MNSVQTETLIALARRLYHNSFVRFCAVGSVGLILNYIIVTIMVDGWGLTWRVGWIFGVMAAITSNYFGNRYFAFRR